MAQPVMVPTGQPYGKAKELADAQRQAPLPSAPAAPGPQSQAGGGATSWEAPVTPLNAPSQRPGEHVMDGVDAGPGRTAAQAGIPGAMANATRDGILNTLRGIYEAFPLDGIKDLISGFAQNAPWTIDDLFIPAPTPAAARVRPTLPVMPGLQPTGETADRIDEQQTLYRSEFDQQRAAAGVGAAAMASSIGNNVGTGNELDVTSPGTAPPDPTIPPSSSDLIRNRTGAQ